VLSATVDVADVADVVISVNCFELSKVGQGAALSIGVERAWKSGGVLHAPRCKHNATTTLARIHRKAVDVWGLCARGAADEKAARRMWGRVRGR
jgi:hypothetical protein